MANLTANSSSAEQHSFTSLLIIAVSNHMVTLDPFSSGVYIISHYNLTGL